MSIKGIDVSKWQGVIDWKKVKSDGVEFAFIRTGYGTNYEDPFFKSNIANAKAAGMKVGVYHYSYATTVAQAEAEAKWTLKLLGNVDLDYPVAFDIEESKVAALGKTLVTSMISAYIKVIKDAGYRAMLYTNTNWRNNYIDMAKLADVPLWQAHYPYANEPDLNKVLKAKPKAIDDRVSIWQCSDKGRVSGISGNVDMNICYDIMDKTAPIVPPAVVPTQPAANALGYIHHVISTLNERMTSGYRTATRPTHNGIDYTDAQRLELKQDVYILAFADGTVTDITVGNLIGYSVSILHAGKLLTRYFHMKANSVLVKVGQKVAKGQKLGVMGTTGDSTGIHLHFETKINSTGGISGTFDNPELWLTGQKTIEGGKVVTPPAVTVKPPATASSFRVGQKVKVKAGAKTYVGGNLASFVYTNVYEISQISNDRAVIGQRNKVNTNVIDVTAAMNVKDLILVS